MCTRLVYLGGPNDTVITARSMDWKVDLGTNLWAFPRGMTREGCAGPNSIQWTSKYGSVVATAYDMCTTDGVNEAGCLPIFCGWSSPSTRRMTVRPPRDCRSRRGRNTSWIALRQFRKRSKYSRRNRSR